MQRLLKTRSKTIESDLPAKKLIEFNPNDEPNNKDSRKPKENEDLQEVLYDDASTVKVSRPEECLYDDASPVPNSPVKSNKPTSNPPSTVKEELYDDATTTILSMETSEDYEYVANESVPGQESHNNNNDSDAVSMKSGISSIGANASSHRWHITAAEAKSQVILTIPY